MEARLRGEKVRVLKRLRFFLWEEHFCSQQNRASQTCPVWTKLHTGHGLKSRHKLSEVSCTAKACFVRHKTKLQNGITIFIDVRAFCCSHWDGTEAGNATRSPVQYSASAFTTRLSKKIRRLSNHSLFALQCTDVHCTADCSLASIFDPAERGSTLLTYMGTVTRYAGLQPRAGHSK
jgi:hypothetical protein